jgi:methionyl aminopeptidase
MRITDKDPFATSGVFRLKNQDWLEKQRVAGKIAAKALLLLEREVNRQSCDSPFLLNQMAEQFIYDSGGTPTFKGYKGFPAGVCISVNKELVHGIPKDIPLQDGDVISFDLGVTWQGAIADTAITTIWGKSTNMYHSLLISATEECLMQGIKYIHVGDRLDSIGHRINRYASSWHYSVVTEYGGHGLDWNIPHASPFVANKGNPNEGIRIQPGLAIAIEPMLVIGSPETRVSEDGWTVMTKDIGAHFEHSIFVHEDHVEIITDRTGIIL